MVALGFLDVEAHALNALLNIKIEHLAGRRHAGCRQHRDHVERDLVPAQQPNAGDCPVESTPPRAGQPMAVVKMLGAIDAVIKEDLFFGVDHGERDNDPVMVKAALDNLALALAAGRPIFILEYPKDRRRLAADKAKIEALGFIPYFGPRNLDRLWLPGARF